jgi:hypothetical protein
MAHHFEGVIGNLRERTTKTGILFTSGSRARGTLSASVALGQGFDARSQWVKTGCLISESSYDRIEKSHRKALT